MKIRNYILITLAACIILLFLYLLLWPVKIKPQAWTPPKAPALEGIYKTNNILTSMEIVGANNILGSESLAIDNDGKIYGGTDNGIIYRIDPDGNNFKIIAKLENRVLGLDFDKNKNLIIAAPYHGLLLITQNGRITILTTEVDGIKFKFLNDVTVAKDGIIYFTDSSYRFLQEENYLEVMEHAPNGRLLSYNPNTKETKVLLDKLYFANGIAISPDQTFLLINETTKYRIRKFWLTGQRKGTADVFIENLPGLPDGLSSNGKGTYWIALFTLRNESLDKLLPKPFLRKILMRLPEFLRPAPRRFGFILGLDDNGKVNYNLQDPTGVFFPNTSVEEYKNKLFIGSLSEKGIGVIAVPKLILGIK